ncbi:uncharacterized protein A4U43_C01F5780 [Asparagus officinalis]|uniref:Protein FAM32A-like n=1 Tax=Asparagus officinalis TaxID=4686 RepID=A0A5P1FRP0_ASPOF|nr:protein FAM32A-like isoform X2 [Asparagus officinalis]ONK79381.1 uncharacterized protein A4U43_C01F5780 [Asparagus officinalis]
MSAFENVVGGKLKLKGKPLNVKAGGVKKKKKKNKYHYENNSETLRNELQEESDKLGDEGHRPSYHHLTPAERRYMEQREKIEMRRLAKMASKSHRDRIQEFNQYLANLTEHYDIPKVGPG